MSGHTKWSEIKHKNRTYRFYSEPAQDYTLSFLGGNMYGDIEKRDEWMFDYPVSEVLAGAEGKLAYHKSRQEHYGQQLREVADKVIELANPDEDEEIMLPVTYAMSGRGAQANDAITKIKIHLEKHRNFVTAYTKYITALRKQDQDKQLPCTVADIAYFGLAD